MEDGNQTAHSSGGDASGGAAGEGKIGRVLEQRRQERGLTLDEAERSTKIRRRYLVGLERDDYTVLPDAVYARGFLKTYAAFLGLDGEELYRERGRPRRGRDVGQEPSKGDPEEPVVPPGDAAVSEGRRIRGSTAVGVAVLVLALLIGGFYFLGRGFQSSGGPSSGPSAGSSRLSQETSALQRAPQDLGQNGGRARRAAPEGALVADGGRARTGVLKVGVAVEGAPAWILVQADSRTVFEEVAQPGFSRTFQARRSVGIRVGNAGAVAVRVNGQNVGALGGSGQVVDKKYTLKSAS